MEEGQARRSTLKDVARLAGVSPASASMALSDSPRVSEATKTAVREAAAQLGYVPHAAGRALRSQRVGAIAVVLFCSSGAAMLFAWRDYMPTFTDASLIAAGTGALIWAVLAVEARPRWRTITGLAVVGVMVGA